MSRYLFSRPFAATTTTEAELFNDILRLAPETECLLFETASAAVTVVANKYGGEEIGKGGYFRFFYVPSLQCEFPDIVQLCEGWVGGEANIDKADKYWVVSMEKALRLAQHLPEGCVSSWGADRNTDKKRYGGAVLLKCLVKNLGNTPGYYLSSFSGLKEAGDEVAMLLTNKDMGWVQPGSINRVLEVGGNNFAHNFFA